MASLKLGEVIVAAVIDKLKASYQGRVLEINAQKNDRIVISAPLTKGGGALDGSDYYRGATESIPTAPAILVMEGPSTYEAEGQHGLVTDIEIAVWILEADPNPEVLAVKLQRQMRAVIETLWDEPPLEALTDSAFRLFPRGTLPGKAFQPDTAVDAWRRFFAVFFTARQIEA